jgi:hypothetical protein
MPRCRGSLRVRDYEAQRLDVQGPPRRPCFGTVGGKEGAMPNGSTYDNGTRPRVLINWDSFINQGINAGWQGPFTDAVINAYTRWMNVAGADVRPRFWNYTTNTTAATGELLVMMDIAFGGGPSYRLASTFYGADTNKATLIFHRRASADMSLWNFVPWNARPGEFDMQGILMHELGHAFGLGHSAVATEVMWGSYNYPYRYGPFDGDVARLKAMNSDFIGNRLRQLRSSDGAVSWAPIANDLTAMNHFNARTNVSPGVCTMPGLGLYNVGWSHPNRIPTSLRTDGDHLLTRRWWFFGGERSVHGPAYAADDRSGLLWAWVNNDDNATLRLAGSTGGLGWGFRSTPANAQCCGTPGLAWARVGGQSTWILAWTHFDRADQANTGFVRVSVSTDDGWNWTAASWVNRATKALSGVSVAVDSSGRVVVAFAFAPHIGVASMNEIFTVHGTLQGGAVQWQQSTTTGEHTRVQPALADDQAHGCFVMAWREQNGATTLATATCPKPGAVWGSKVMLLDRPSHVAPTVAASPDYAESSLWYAYEGTP